MNGDALPSELQCGDTKIFHKQDIANKLNEHFVTKGHILASKLPDSNTPILESMKSRNNISLTEWGRIDAAEIISIIKSDIHANKSTGFDGVPATYFSTFNNLFQP